jgi:CBS-domain-containing membrane protein
MKCRDLMTSPPVTCTLDDHCAHVAQLMRDHDIGSVPVVETRESRKIAGVITDRDICCRVVAEDRRAGQIAVREVMSDDVVSCDEDDRVDLALVKMAQNQVRRIPIVDADGLLVGVIAQADIAREAETRPKVDEVVEQVSQPNERIPEAWLHMV